MLSLHDAFADSCLKKGKFKTRQALNINTSPSTADPLYPDNTETMMTLLHIASRVEAAIQAYISVQGFADPGEWKENFEREMVSFIYTASWSLTI